MKVILELPEETHALSVVAVFENSAGSITTTSYMVKPHNGMLLSRDDAPESDFIEVDLDE